jgi:hypothetical protein
VKKEDSSSKLRDSGSVAAAAAGAAEVNCPDCNTPNKPAAKFCRKCGRKGPLVAPVAVPASKDDAPAGRGGGSPRAVSPRTSVAAAAASTSPRQSTASSPREDSSKESLTRPSQRASSPRGETEAEKKAAMRSKIAAAAAAAKQPAAKDTSAEDALVCPACKTQNKDGWKFCRKCGGKPGAAVAVPPAGGAAGLSRASKKEVPCDGCDTNNPVGFKFCRSCGKPGPKAPGDTAAAAAAPKGPTIAQQWKEYQAWAAAKTEESRVAIESAEDYGLEELGDFIASQKVTSAKVSAENSERFKVLGEALKKGPADPSVKEAQVKATFDALEEVLRSALEDITDRLEGLKARAANQAKKEAAAAAAAAFQEYKSWSDQRLEDLDEAEEPKGTTEQMKALLERATASTTKVQNEAKARADAVVAAIRKATGLGAQVTVTEAQVEGVGKILREAQKTMLEDISTAIARSQKKAEEFGPAANAKWEDFRSWVIARMQDIDEATESAENYGLEELGTYLTRIKETATKVGGEAKFRVSAVIELLNKARKNGEKVDATDKDVENFAKRLETSQTNSIDDVMDRMKVNKGFRVVNFRRFFFSLVFSPRLGS